MKIRALLVPIASVLAVAILTSVGMVGYWQHNQPVFRNAGKVLAATQAFTRHQNAVGKPIPGEVSLSELIKSGYVSPGDVHAFDGMEVLISLHPSEKQPGCILVSARLPDGTVNALLADGSVQQLSARKFEQYRRQSGQPAESPNEQH